MSEPMLEAGSALNAGRYVIEEYMGRGSVKTVYAARDEILQRRVAVAQIRADVDQRGDVSADVWEARVLGALGTHPNIVTIFDRWAEDDCGYIVSELLTGGDLAKQLSAAREAEDCLGMADVLRWSQEICEGLGHVHARDVAHLDVQPSNVFLDDRLIAHLGDFDLAAVLQDGLGQPTALGQTTDAYIAPEIPRGEPVGPQADLYSLGATMYELVSGEPPFTGRNRDEVIRKHLNDTPRPLSEVSPRCGQGLSTLVSSLLAKDPRDRPATTVAVSDAIAACRTAALQDDTTDLVVLIGQGEHERLEFKASLRAPSDAPWSSLTKAQRQEVVGWLQSAVTTAVAAFLNTRGGTLLIGVQDDGKVLGIERDLETLSSNRSLDGWRLALDQALETAMGSDIASSVTVRMRTLKGMTVAMVSCQQRTVPTWHQEDLIVRRGASSKRLTPREAVQFVQDRWG